MDVQLANVFKGKLFQKSHLWDCGPGGFTGGVAEKKYLCGAKHTTMRRDLEEKGDKNKKPCIKRPPLLLIFTY